MKATLIGVCIITLYLIYRIFQLEAEVKQLQTNAAIAALSAEAANAKIGAIAPYFAQDKEAFARAWLDNLNLPPAVYPDDVLIPLKRSLEEKRMSKEMQLLKAETFR
jgi:hypothetical protein